MVAVMLGIVCQVCGKRPATAHLTELGPDSGERRELHICATCVDRLSLNLATDPPSIADILASGKPSAETQAASGKDEVTEAAEEIGEDVACPVCGLTFAEFTTKNRFGCAACYEAFGAKVEQLLGRYHGSAIHTGRQPIRSSPGASGLLIRRTQLDAALKQAIDAEDYEKAARLRDELKQLDAQAP